MIDFTCRHCGWSLKADAKHAGQIAKCPKCKLKVTLPGGPSVFTQDPLHPPRSVGPTPTEGTPQPPQRKSLSSLGVASLVLGILAVLISWMPVINFFSLVLALTGLLLALFGYITACRTCTIATHIPAAGLFVCIAALVITTWIHVATPGESLKSQSSVGQKVVLGWFDPDEPDLMVPGPVDSSACVELAEVMDRTDETSWYSLIGSGRVLVLLYGTEALVLDERPSVGLYKVRLLSGLNSNRVVWVPIQCTRKEQP